MKNEIIRNIKNIKHTEGDNFFLIAGPCVVESEEMTRAIAERVAEISDELKIPFVFKASYKKANRSRLDSFTGMGNEKGLEILARIAADFKLPVLTDVHSAEDAILAAKYVDVLQIPAFLCRQTDLLVAAAETGKHVNVKKGQFLSPSAMEHAISKVRNSGNQNVMATERGTTFGYQDLVVDFRGIPEMQAFDVPVVMDVTHSLQQPNQTSGVTGGRPDMIATIAAAAIAAGADGLFIETHPEPSKALSDGANMLHLNDLRSLMEKMIRIRKAII